MYFIPPKMKVVNGVHLLQLLHPTVLFEIKPIEGKYSEMKFK